MENKKLELHKKVSMEIVDVFKKNNIKPFEMGEILDYVKLAIDMSMIEILLKLKNK